MRQPSGQRVKDKLAFVDELLRLYDPEAWAAVLQIRERREPIT